MNSEKYPTPRGPAATAAKNKYRNKNYDRVELILPKGMKEQLEQAVSELGYRSKNSFIVDAVSEKYERDLGRKMEPENSSD